MVGRGAAVTMRKIERPMMASPASRAPSVTASVASTGVGQQTSAVPTTSAPRSSQEMGRTSQPAKATVIE